MSLRAWQLKRPREYRRDVLNYARCRDCLDAGFVVLRALEPQTHGGGVVNVVVTFRAPCDCHRGVAWALQRQGKA